MNKSDFPYQLVVFLDRIPQIGEPVYAGENGWFAQVAIKRRFTCVDSDEESLCKMLGNYFQDIEPFTVETTELQSNERMPVRFIGVIQSDTIMNLHDNIITLLGDAIISRFPERDGDNYLPHVTAEYHDDLVIDPDAYSHQSYEIKSIWLLKDIEDANSIAYKEFLL